MNAVRSTPKVAVEAIRGERTLSQLASQYHVHRVQIGQWRKTALEQMAELFVDGRSRKRGNDEAEKDALYEQVGRLKIELDWLKKKWACAGINRHGVEDERASRERSSDPLGPEFCAGLCEVSSEA